MTQPVIGWTEIAQRKHPLAFQARIFHDNIGNHVASASLFVFITLFTAVK